MTMKPEKFLCLLLILPLLLIMSCTKSNDNPTNAGSHAPTIAPAIPDLHTPVSTTLQLNLAPYEQDPVTPPDQLIWSITGLNPDKASASINNTTKILTIIPVAAVVGLDSFMLTLTDNAAYMDSQRVHITIGGVIYPSGSQFVVFAWNTLGMHCLNPSYDSLVILPPYNDLHAQVILRGNPPQIVTSGVWIDYSVINNTYSYGKRDYGQFWDNCQALFGTTLPNNFGLNLTDPIYSNTLTGTMIAKTGHFEADGIPLTPVNDNNVWNPYQVADLKVRDAQGVVAETHATIPTSDEIDCALCHGPYPFTDILHKHDVMHGTNLMNQTPVLCASCHHSPALGMQGPGEDGYMSYVIHHSHAPRGATCYNCHPGAITQCSRSIAHTAPGGNCITCHGDMDNVANTIVAGRVPWVTEPKCVQCHDHQGVPDVDTGDQLYRNSSAHNGLNCTTCHGSPHAMVPTTQASDNYQAMQYQGVAKTISTCSVCHDNSKGEQGEIQNFAEQHGGLNPQQTTACNICHTNTPANTAQWPHAYGWHARP
jgi:hypothetical protein